MYQLYRFYKTQRKNPIVDGLANRQQRLDNIRRGNLMFTGKLVDVS